MKNKINLIVNVALLLTGVTLIVVGADSDYSQMRMHLFEAWGAVLIATGIGRACWDCLKM